jgi:hypothetical protein
MVFPTLSMLSNTAVASEGLRKPTVGQCSSKEPFGCTWFSPARRLKLCTSCDLHEFTTTSLCKTQTCKGDSSIGIHKFSKCIICYFAYLWFIEHRNTLLHSPSRCTHPTALSHTTALHFHKYSPYQNIFKIKCVDLNVICILCHILIIYTTNRSVSSNKVQCVPHVNMKP